MSLSFFSIWPVCLSQTHDTDFYIYIFLANLNKIHVWDQTGEIDYTCVMDYYKDQNTLYYQKR